MPAPVENRLYFADYRETDGLQFPFRLRRAVGPDTIEETTFDRFKINPEDRSPSLREPKIARAGSGRVAESQASMVTLLVALLTWSAAAQPARDARATITVVDQTGAVIPNADVTLTPLTPPATPLPPVQTNDKGIATLPALAPGHYTVKAEFPGFAHGILKDVQLKAGDNKHVVVLALEGRAGFGHGSRDAREAASDRRSTFGTAMTREQIDALSDDPDEMAQQLQDMAGGNAVIRVDSFEGGRLPPKSAIKAIHITRDAFAAENHYAGGLFIDIITQPGIGPLRTNLNMRLRDGSLSGKNELRRRKGTRAHAELQRRLRRLADQAEGVVLDQPEQRSTQFETPVYLPAHAGRHAGQLARPAPAARQRVHLRPVRLRASPAIRRCGSTTAATSSRPRTSASAATTPLSAATRSRNHSNTIRIQEAGPLGRRFFINTRASIGWSDSATHSVFEGRTDPGDRRSSRAAASS